LTRRRAALAGCAAAGALALAAGCGGGSTGGAGSTHGAGSAHAGPTATASSASFEGGVISPRQAAPPLRLKDVKGRVVDIRGFRGHPVFVTFVYAHCPDVCPLIMENLHRVQTLSGPLGKKMRVIAVSVDPTGDRPAVVRTFLKAHRVTGLVRYTIGTRPQLEKVWSAWRVGAQIPRGNPDLVEHSALVYGVTASGQLATAYPVGFRADAIARDVPLLARS